MAAADPGTRSPSPSSFVFPPINSGVRFAPSLVVMVRLLASVLNNYPLDVSGRCQTWATPFIPFGHQLSSARGWERHSAVGDRGLDRSLSLLRGQAPYHLVIASAALLKALSNATF